MNTPLNTLDCKWPDIAPPYSQALQAAVTYILERFPVLGIVASGSIIRGNPGPTSDLDMCVIHTQPQRQRLQRIFHGVPAEIFVNPPHMIRSYFASEHAEGRPCTAHMFVTGFSVLDNDPILAELRAEAQAWLQKAPTFTARELLGRRYSIVDLLDNARDTLDSDPECAARVLHQAVHDMVEYVFLANQRFLPRLKELIAKLQEIDTDLEQLVRAYYQAKDIQTQAQLADAMAQRTIGVTEFFEWETQLEAV